MQSDDDQTIIDLNFSFTDDTVATNVEDAKANASKLNLLTKTVPLIGGIVGLLALIGGLIMARTAPARSPRPTSRRTLPSRRCPERNPADPLLERDLTGSAPVHARRVPPEGGTLRMHG